MSTLASPNLARHLESYSIPVPPPHLLQSHALRGETFDPSLSPTDTHQSNSAAESSVEPRSSTSITEWEASRNPGTLPTGSGDTPDKRRSAKRDKYSRSRSGSWADRLARLRQLMPVIWQRLKDALHERSSPKGQATAAPVGYSTNDGTAGQGTPLDPIDEQWNAEGHEHASSYYEEAPSQSGNTSNGHVTSVELEANDIVAEREEHCPTSVEMFTPVPAKVEDEEKAGHASPLQLPDSRRQPESTATPQETPDWSATQGSDMCGERHPRSRPRTDSGQDDSPKYRDVITDILGDSKQIVTHTIRRLSSSNALSYVSPRSFGKRGSRTFSRRSLPSADHFGSRILDRVFSSLQEEGMAEDIHRLVQAGADVHAVTHQGETALHFAVRRGYSEVCGILLWGGADARAKTKNGLDPYHYAHHAERTADDAHQRARIANCRRHVKCEAPGGAEMHRHPLSSKFSLPQSILNTLDDLRRACDDLDRDAIRCQLRREEFDLKAKATGLQPVNTTFGTIAAVRPGDPDESATDYGRSDRSSWEGDDGVAPASFHRDDSVVGGSPVVAENSANHSSSMGSEPVTPTQSRMSPSPTSGGVSNATPATDFPDLSTLGIRGVGSHHAQSTVLGGSGHFDNGKSGLFDAAPHFMAAELESTTQSGLSETPRSEQDSASAYQTDSAPSLVPSAQHQSPSNVFPNSTHSHSLDIPSIAAPVAIQSARPALRQIRSGSKAIVFNPTKAKPANADPTAAASDLTAMATYAFQTSWYLDSPDKPSWPSNDPRNKLREHAVPRVMTSSVQSESVLPEPQSAAERINIKSLVVEFEESTAWLSCRHNWPRNYGNSLCLEGCPPLNVGMDGYTAGSLL